jgi:hypothetical protein
VHYFIYVMYFNEYYHQKKTDSNGVLLIVKANWRLHPFTKLNNSLLRCYGIMNNESF